MHSFHAFEDAGRSTLPRDRILVDCLPADPLPNLIAILMRSPRPFLLMILAGLSHVAILDLHAGEIVNPGDKLESLNVGPVIYTQVQVRSYNARTLMITHSKGMASIRLKDLAPEWQARFKYDPAAEAAAELADNARAIAAKPVPPPPKPRSENKPHMNLEGLLQQFGKPVKLQPEVDLRQSFFKLELGVKNQGNRPSCSIFAVVSALEFENAELTDHVEKFSEEYLIWAVRKTVQRIPVDPTANAGNQRDADLGFTLTEVVSALRAYGIPPKDSMPNQFGIKIEDIEDPPVAVIKEARAKQRVFVHQLPGRDNATRIANIIHALNNRLPIVIGLAWPNYHSLRNAYLDAQTPMTGAGHAITLVGYRNPTGNIEDASFIFKNSWGVNWGQGGYGIVTYRYLNNFLNEAVLLEVFAG